MTVAEFPDKPQITTANQTHQIRQGRSRFIAMAGAYSLGNFNDNFMKQAVSLLAVSHGQVPCSGHNYGLTEQGTRSLVLQVVGQTKGGYRHGSPA